MADMDEGRRCRIAHVITDLDIGGAERMLVRLAGELSGSASQLVVSLCAPGAFAVDLGRLAIPMVSLGLPRGRMHPRAVTRAVGTLRRFRPDILQSWMYHADLLATLVWPLVGRPPLAWNLRCADMELEHYARTTRWVRSVLARLSGVPAVVVCNSEASRRAHEVYGYRPRRWQVIGNGYDTARFRPRASAREDLRARLGMTPASRLVGMIARVDPAKDHDTLLDAVRQVCNRHPDVTFLLVGSDVPSLANAVRVRGLHTRVILEDARDDIAELTAGLDLCVLSSAFGESFPNFIGEAMACGVPCVCTDVGDVRELLAEVGLVVPRRDPTVLAEALCEALAWTPAERARRGAAARARIERRYALPVIAARYRALYAGLSARCAPERVF